MSKIIERSYEEIKERLDMLMKEKKEDHLLSLQNLQETIQEMDDASESLLVALP